MKQIAVAAVALVLGVILGGLGPRGEVRALEEKMAGMTSDGPCTSTVGSDLAALMSPRTQQRAPSTRNPLGDRDPDVIAEESPEAVELVEQMNDEDVGEELAEGVQNIPSEELELARTALELRRAQARAVLLEDARPDETQMETIDGAVTEMNDQLMGMADELATMIENGEEPSRREAMEFAADALDTMLVAEESMRAALDADQLGDLEDGALDPFSYVDPELVTVLEGLGAAE
ncbi:MAG: hypothetical protein KDA24_15650 [Deltaproteobacteria bacterium]|nr:hypothetical protein [Deltaproteobacteria bacterium]